MNPLIQSKNTTILPVLIALTLACFALSPQARAVCQQGCDIPSGNTFLGDDALVNDTTGFDNTAVGGQALDSNTTGTYNTANGADALFYNTTGHFNTANGAFALFGNLAGRKNTANGAFALTLNISGDSNTANGSTALANNTSGSLNTADGVNALLNNTTGRNNIALGHNAGSNLITGSFNINIGNSGVADESNTIRIGTTGTHANTYMAGISGATVPTGIAVIVDGGGHLGTTTSSARFKEAIKPMDKASETLFSLKPVTFRYKHELDPEGIPQFGLVAEEVEKVNPDLVARDEQGKPYTVRYEAVNAMLLNEFLKEHQTVQEQQKEIDALKAELEEQRSLIHKVSTRLEKSNPLPRTIASNH